MKKVLIVGATHGHEKIGLLVQKALGALPIDQESVHFITGNPEAERLSKPYIESDLNRVFPGQRVGTYEERRAAELVTVMREYDLVIDIHSTNTTDLGSDSMLIVTQQNAEIYSLINLIRPPKVLLMRHNAEGALITHAKLGITFEYGNDSSTAVLEATLHDIATILVSYGLLDKNPYQPKNTPKETEVFEVYDSFQKDFSGSYVLDDNVRNFAPLKTGDIICIQESGDAIHAMESFVPILFGENRYTRILGFKGRKLTNR